MGFVPIGKKMGGRSEMQRVETADSMAERLYGAASALAKKGEMHEAVRRYHDLLRMPSVFGPWRAKIYNDLGLISFWLGDLIHAEQFFVKAIFAYTLYTDAYKNLMQISAGKAAKRHKFSVIISTYNRCAYLKRCVESLRQNSFFPLEIIIVCDPSPDGTAGYVERERQNTDIIGLINETHIGHTKSLNKGARAATGNYICFLNDDVLVMPGWDLSIVATIDKDRTAGCGVSLIICPDGRVQSPGQHNPYLSFDHDWIGRVPFVDIAGVVGQSIEAFPQFQVPRECDYGYFPVMKRECLEKVGLVDEQFEHFFIDPDHGYRVQQWGYRNIYCPTSVMIHYELSKNDPVLLEKQFSADIVKFARKWRLYQLV
jgi:GT2 family glycosyltransferase